MYRTAKELHIAFNLKAQWINSNRERVLQDEEIDMLLNRAMYQFIDTRCSNKLNSRKEGFEQTQKRYDDLQEIKKTIALPAYIDGDNIGRVSVPLPYDYYHLVNSRSKLKYNCRYLTKTLQSSGICQSIVVPIVGGSGVYNVFTLDIDYTVNGIPNTSTILDFNNYSLPDISDDNVFEFINIALDSYNNLNNQIEMTYTTLNGQNYFVIICREPSVNFTLSTATSYGLNVYDATTLTDVIGYDLVSNMTSPNELISSQKIDELLGDYYFTKDMQSTPLSTIDDSSLCVYENSSFVVIKVSLTYIRKPRLINLNTNQGCELDKGDEIVDIAVELAKADVASPSYQYTVNDNLKKE